jgi:hypothetical protein
VFLKVEVERMRARAEDKLISRLPSARHNADEKRAPAELKRNRATARTAEQAEHIRRTGQMPPSFGCWKPGTGCSRERGKKKHGKRDLSSLP